MVIYDVGKTIYIKASLPTVNLLISNQSI